MTYRKILALSLACTLAFPVTAFAAKDEKADKATDITLWTYPIGSWGDAATVDLSLIHI